MKSFKNLFPFVNIYVTITLIWAKKLLNKKRMDCL